ncbi:sugar ABC transporter ATP-binding protein [Mycetocola sp.]|uniref:sugar ABC transporter ATP-binding protein n=1 Tax=Mycetocola sp. TaxID=1871042 RepID=UPI00262C2443|nr:sugar ABC transporter ATP-binding protein [Mycetocola sp.]MCU1419068.1 transporter related protein [Mycetocola sp.]MCU1561194.1 transporter related protein [Mycetocola sp.]
MTAMLAVENIVQQYPGVRALKGVSLSLDTGRVLALVGENGAGKSTLIRILAGIEQPVEGSLRLRGESLRLTNSAESQAAGISVVSQEFRLVPELSIADNIMLGHELTSGGVVRARNTRNRVQELLSTLGLDLNPDRLVSSLTTGDQQMVEIARALSRDFDVLIMDEPTAALNRAEIGRLHGIVRRLAAQGKAIMYVSHHLDEVFDLCDEVAVLRDGILVHRSETSELDEQALVEHMLGRKPQTFERAVDAAAAGNDPRLVVDGLRVGGFDEPFSLSVGAGEIVGLAGLVGSGRGELTRALFGDRAALAGRISIDGVPVQVRSVAAAISAGIYMLSEDRKSEGILPHLDVTENTMVSRDPKSVSGWRRLVPSRRSERAVFERLRGELSIRVPHGGQLIGNLSGGNQQKVLLGRALQSGCRVLLLNEPTRGVDVGAKLEIYQLIRRLAAQGVAVIVSSSDAPELAAISDRCLVYLAGRQTAELAGPDITEDNIVGASVGQVAVGGTHG